MSEDTGADLVLVAEQQRALLAQTKAMREDLAALVVQSRQMDERWRVWLAELVAELRRP